MDSERKLLKEIDDALQRIEKRTYGICEGTGKPIAKARLEAQPWAKYCVEYARMLEQGLVEKQEESISEPQEYESKDTPEKDSSWELKTLRYSAAAGKDIFHGGLK